MGTAKERESWSTDPTPTPPGAGRGRGRNRTNALHRISSLLLLVAGRGVGGSADHLGAVAGHAAGARCIAFPAIWSCCSGWCRAKKRCWRGTGLPGSIRLRMPNPPAPATWELQHRRYLQPRLALTGLIILVVDDAGPRGAIGRPVRRAPPSCLPRPSVKTAGGAGRLTASTAVEAGAGAIAPGTRGGWRRGSGMIA